MDKGLSPSIHAMSSKLDYLSKYTQDARVTGKSTKKEKRRKKKHKTRQDVALALKDEDPTVDDAFPSHDEHEDDDLDEPAVLVELPGESDVKREPQGTWEPIPNENSRDGVSGREYSPSRTRRKRYDSDDDESTQGGSGPCNSRHDSIEHRPDISRDDSERKLHSKASTKKKASRRRGSHDSDSDRPSDRRKRYDSDENSLERYRRPRKRVDSDDNNATFDTHANSTPRDLPTGRKRCDSEDSGIDNGEVMSSGHKAGLQSGGRFSRVESRIQKSRTKDAQIMVDKYGMGETVFRDRTGKQVEEPLPPAHQRGRPQIDPEMQRQLNTGKVQRERELAEQQDMSRLQNSSFARHAGDSELEAARKEAIRVGDPMAAYTAQNQQQKTEANSNGMLHVRPVYKGPSAKPNRYGIRPGFRWDGMDRGNDWEDKLLSQRYNHEHQNEQAYRWSTADM
jgi:pre-mRNA-splicing factor CWC26